MVRPWEYKSPGIPDDYFIKGEAPLTKEEVRALIMSKLKVREDGLYVDIGAGTGGITVELAHLASEGEIISIERKRDRLSLIAENLRHFQLLNVTLIHGEAPCALEGLPPVDGLVLGGSGGHLKEIIAKSKEILKEGSSMIISAVTLETLTNGFSLLEEYDLNPQLTSLTIHKTKEIGNYHLLEAQNQIFVLTGERGRCE